MKSQTYMWPEGKGSSLQLNALILETMLRDEGESLETQRYREKCINADLMCG